MVKYTLLRAVSCVFRYEKTKSEDSRINRTWVLVGHFGKESGTRILFRISGLEFFVHPPARYQF